MTREEAIERLKMILEEATTDEDAVCYVTLDDADALEMAIKALEDEAVLDKIRAEIIEKFGNCSICEWFEDYDYEENDISEYRLVGDVSDVIDIINKYKTESEDNA